MPTFVGRQTNTIIDFTLTYKCITGWEDMEKGYRSDHLPISFILPTTANKTYNNVPNLKLAAWPKFAGII